MDDRNVCDLACICCHRPKEPFLKRRLILQFAFPNHDDVPAEFSQLLIVPRVTLYVAGELTGPDSVRVFGITAFVHPAWQCQKQPWTKITVPNRGKTISGLPGNALRKVKRRPPRCSSDLTRRSGPVFLLRIRLMFQLRRSGVNLSISPFPKESPSNDLRTQTMTSRWPRQDSILHHSYSFRPLRRCGPTHQLQTV